jgi:hypothetical protein
MNRGVLRSTTRVDFASTVFSSSIAEFIASKAGKNDLSLFLYGLTEKRTKIMFKANRVYLSSA